MNFDSDWDYYDQYENNNEQQSDYDADMADLPTCDEDY
jgi:hypothetical protein